MDTEGVPDTHTPTHTLAADARAGKGVGEGAGKGMGGSAGEGVGGSAVLEDVTAAGLDAALSRLLALAPRYIYMYMYICICIYIYIYICI